MWENEMSLTEFFSLLENLFPDHTYGILELEGYFPKNIPVDDNFFELLSQKAYGLLVNSETLCTIANSLGDFVTLTMLVERNKTIIEENLKNSQSTLDFLSKSKVLFEIVDGTLFDIYISGSDELAIKRLISKLPKMPIKLTVNFEG